MRSTQSVNLIVVRALQPQVRDGRITYEDSPLVRALQDGSVLVVEIAAGTLWRSSSRRRAVRTTVATRSSESPLAAVTAGPCAKAGDPAARPAIIRACASAHEVSAQRRCAAAGVNLPMNPPASSCG